MTRVKSRLRYLLLPVTLVTIGLVIFIPTLFDRSAGRFNVNKQIHSPLFKAYNNDIILLFFGYAGCVDVCTPRLQEMADIYKDIKKKEKVQVLFINLIPVADEKLPEQFASAFHPDFKGVYPGKEELETLKKEFDLYIVRSLFNKNEYDHTSFLFLLQKGEKGYMLKHIYIRVPFDKSLILNDIERLTEK